MKLKWRVSAILTLVTVLLLALSGCIIADRVTGSAFRVQGDSMTPSIKSGTIVTIDKNAYKTSEPERGDIIIFFKSDINYVRRVIGLPEEQIQIKAGLVYVNGVKLDEPYIRQGAMTEPEGSFVVPDAHVFVMCDNRDNVAPHDSRTMGFVPVSDIKGKINQG